MKGSIVQQMVLWLPSLQDKVSCFMKRNRALLNIPSSLVKRETALYCSLAIMEYHVMTKTAEVEQN